MLNDLIKTVRPKQWYKNIIVFAGLVFSFNLFNGPMLLKTIVAFIIFCAISGSVYIFNDIHDKEKDSKHPKKKNRSIASGRIGVGTAAFLGIVLFIFSMLASYFLINMTFFIIVIGYFILIDAYTYWLKRMAVVDVMVISIGFVLRAIAGVVAISVSLSPWLILCTFLLALFLALGKRKHELVLSGKNSVKARESLGLYSKEMLESFVTITASLIIISYSLYTFLASSIWMMITIPFVIFAIFKYMQLLNLKILGEETEVMFKNRAMVTDLVIWFVLAILILYNVLPSLFEGLFAI